MEEFGIIRFWEKNLIDLDASNILLSSNDPGSVDNGTPYLPFLRNRNNVSLWSSTGGTGAASIEVILNGLTSFESIMLVDNNFLTYDLSYLDAASGLEVQIVSVTGNTNPAPIHEFPKVNGHKVFIKNITQQMIHGTATPQGSKRLGQLIITRKILEKELPGKPLIKNLEISRTKKFNRMISGKFKPVSAAGAFSAKVEIQFLNDPKEIVAIQRIFALQEGVLIHMNAQSQNELWNVTEGYRPIDFYLVTPKNDFDPAPFKETYDFFKSVMDLVEVV